MTDLTSPEYADAIESFIAAIQSAVQLTMERDQARAALARVNDVAAKWATKRDEQWRPLPWRSVYGEFVDNIRDALDPPIPNPELPVAPVPETMPQSTNGPS